MFLEDRYLIVKSIKTLNLEVEYAFQLKAYVNT